MRAWDAGAHTEVFGWVSNSASQLLLDGLTGTAEDVTMETVCTRMCLSAADTYTLGVHMHIQSPTTLARSAHEHDRAWSTLFLDRFV